LNKNTKLLYKCDEYIEKIKLISKTIRRKKFKNVYTNKLKQNELFTFPKIEFKFDNTFQYWGSKKYKLALKYKKRKKKEIEALDNYSNVYNKLLDSTHKKIIDNLKKYNQIKTNLDNYLKIQKLIKQIFE